MLDALWHTFKIMMFVLQILLWWRNSDFFGPPLGKSYTSGAHFIMLELLWPNLSTTIFWFEIRFTFSYIQFLNCPNINHDFIGPFGISEILFAFGAHWEFLTLCDPLARLWHLFHKFLYVEKFLASLAHSVNLIPLGPFWWC